MRVLSLLLQAVGCCAVAAGAFMLVGVGAGVTISGGIAVAVGALLEREA